MSYLHGVVHSVVSVVVFSNEVVELLEPPTMPVTVSRTAFQRTTIPVLPAAALWSSIENGNGKQLVKQVSGRNVSTRELNHFHH